MAKLRMMFAVFFLTVALGASFGVSPVAATEPDHEIEARFARRTLDSDFLRHNLGSDLGTVKAGAGAGMALARRTLDSDFLRHNLGNDLGTVKAGAGAGMALGRRTLDSDFLRHNVDTPHVDSYQTKR